jgi:hypothetical protein
MYEAALLYAGIAAGCFVFASMLAMPRTLSEWGFVLVCAIFWPFALIIMGVGLLSGDMG